jgi:hypothetical protein
MKRYEVIAIPAVSYGFRRSTDYLVHVLSVHRFKFMADYERNERERCHREHASLFAFTFEVRERTS